MSGVYSRTAQCGMKVMFAAMRLLKEQGGSCRLSVLRSLLGECCDFSGWELENVGGSVRWHIFLSRGIPPAMWLLASSESRGVLGI